MVVTILNKYFWKDNYPKIWYCMNQDKTTVLPLSFPHSQSHRTYHSQSSSVFHEVRLIAFVLCAMKLSFNYLMRFMLHKCLYLTENKLSCIFMPSEVISFFYYWHFNQTDIIQWILYCFHRAFSLIIQLTNKCTNINYFIVFINIDAFPYTCFGP